MILFSRVLVDRDALEDQTVGAEMRLDRTLDSKIGLVMPYLATPPLIRLNPIFAIASLAAEAAAPPVICPISAKSEFGGAAAAARGRGWWLSAPPRAGWPRRAARDLAGIRSNRDAPCRDSARRDVSGSGVDFADVPARLGAAGKCSVRKPPPFSLAKMPLNSPLRVGQGAEIEQIDDQKVAGLRAFDLEGTAERCTRSRFTSRTSLALSLLPICPPVQS